MPEIVLKRPGGYKTDRLRSYQVYVDGEKVGRIKPDETKVFSVPSGCHDLRLKLDWGASEKLQFEPADNAQAQFICGPRVKENDVGILIGARQTYWMTLGCRRYIDLRAGHDLAAEVEPQRWLQNLHPPTLFGIALLIGLAFWGATGQSIVLLGVVVAGISLVVSGLIGRGIGKLTVQGAEDLQRRRKTGNHDAE